ncbi:DinB family protein [Nocardiopsis baichengensis]|uniref:TIGR03086 family protein n=1 Tax=Nocardiopsis baichengensis TaxID=280240 RepID=UPI001EF9CDB5|nr:TIGR03086 family protein [Nocardiopsis baichengensis]
MVNRAGGPTVDDRGATGGFVPDHAHALLERAVGAVLNAAQHARPEFFERPTPCAGWNLEMLLLHTADSLDTLGEGLGEGRVALFSTASVGHDAISEVRIRACRLLRLPAGGGAAAVADRSLGTAALAGVGALEAAVHAWDIAASCGAPGPVPPDLAAALLPVVPLVVTDATRHRLFADPVPAPPWSGAADRLAALTGRDPRRKRP